MQPAVTAFQRKLFILLLYSSAYAGTIIDFILPNARTAFYGLFDGIMLLLGITSLAFISARLAFILLFLVSCFIINFSYSEVTLFASLNGTREIFIVMAMVVFFSKVFAEGNEEMAEDYIDIVKKFGFVFLILQIPAAFQQYLQYGPSDAVGGTLGMGSSGVLTLTVVCLVYYLHFFARNFSVNVLLYITLIPLLLNETKVSFILIPMMILFIWVKLQAKNIILGLGGAVLFFILFNTFYSASYLDFDNSAAGIFSAEFLNDYLMADIYTYEDIPRFTKIILAWNFLSEQTNTFLFGFEYGLFKGGSTGEFSQFAQTYSWMLVGTRPYLFFLMMQGGMMLVAGFMWMMVHVNRYFRGANKYNIFLFIIFVVMLGYNDIFRNQFYVTLYMFLVFYANSPLYEKHLKNNS